MVVFGWGGPICPLGIRVAKDSPKRPSQTQPEWATTFVRAERFSDGAIESAVEQGYFDAVIDRLLGLR